MSNQPNMQQHLLFIFHKIHEKSVLLLHSFALTEALAALMLLMALKRSRNLPLLSYPIILCRSKSSKVALTSVRNVCSEDDALKTFMRLITVAMISEYTSPRFAQRTDWWIYAVLRYQVRAADLSGVEPVLSLSLLHHGWNSIISN